MMLADGIPDIYDANQLLSALISPATVGTTNSYHIALIRSHLIVVGSSTLQQFEDKLCLLPTKFASVSGGKDDHNIDLLDFVSYTHLVIVHANKNVHITHGYKFKYWFSGDNPPLLGSTSDRQQNPELVLRANKCAKLLLTRHQHKTWIFSNG